jgi:hypothetical protein
MVGLVEVEDGLGKLGSQMGKVTAICCQLVLRSCNERKG